ncbi:hypothetical protein Sp245p_26610 (plasmid) [Azospirillum baldaniorum]|uniref:Uncharacterized protein n=1 Tax=Azospirillum baldaniorum TaxID=1064539 RepID=A0A9P1K1X2_9PROT|nr:hypothetical protein Sp245p_26610 [Azospirillum baldaniorum]CCD04010.1 protein of unknown function [Azospirillum baldaniorum]
MESLWPKWSWQRGKPVEAGQDGTWRRQGAAFGHRAQARMVRVLSGKSTLDQLCNRVLKALGARLPQVPLRKMVAD